MVENNQKFGVYACGILVFWSALRAEIKLRIYLNFLIFLDVRLRHTYMGSRLNGEKSFKIYTKSNRI